MEVMAVVKNSLEVSGMESTESAQVQNTPNVKRLFEVLCKHPDVCR